MLPLGVLVPPVEPAPGLPTDRPLGRVALQLASEGLDVVVGHHLRDGELHGLRATPRGWEPAMARVRAIYDRFPSAGRAVHWQRLWDEGGALPWGNPPTFNAWCRDKLATQHDLQRSGVLMPDVVGTAEEFAPALASWGAAFHKPRDGAFGEGVARVERGHPLPPDGILQRAVEPPDGWAGWSVRVLVQRRIDGDWVARPAALRRSRTDPVVNAARGAEVAPADDVLSAATRSAMDEAVGLFVAHVAHRPDGALVLEAGLDFAIGRDGTPFLLEVNGRPRGHGERLARLDPARFGRAHEEAHAAPLRRLRAVVAHPPARSG